MEVWKYGYFPFTLGGKTHRPIKCEMPADGPHSLGMGFEGYIVKMPNGGTRIAEADSHGIVGDTLEQVRADINKAGHEGLEYMRTQVKEKAEEYKHAQTVTYEEFWASEMRRAGFKGAST